MGTTNSVFVYTLNCAHGGRAVEAYNGDDTAMQIVYDGQDVWTNHNELWSFECLCTDCNQCNLHSSYSIGVPDGMTLVLLKTGHMHVGNWEFSQQPQSCSDICHLPWYIQHNGNDCSRLLQEEEEEAANLLLNEAEATDESSNAATTMDSLN